MSSVANSGWIGREESAEVVPDLLLNDLAELEKFWEFRFPDPPDGVKMNL